MPDELSATEVGKEIGEHANHANCRGGAAASAASDSNLQLIETSGVRRRQVRKGHQ